MSLGRFDSYTLPPRPAANAACGAAKSPYLCASRGPIIEGYAPPAALHPGQAAAAHLRLGARGGRLVHVGGLSRCERGGRGHGERPPGERHHPDRRPAANLRDPAPRQRARRGRQPGGPGVSAGPRAPDARGGPRGDAAGGPSGSADRRRRARQHRWRAPALAHRQRVPRHPCRQPRDGAGRQPVGLRGDPPVRDRARFAAIRRDGTGQGGRPHPGVSRPVAPPDELGARARAAQSIDRPRREALCDELVGGPVDGPGGSRPPAIAAPRSAARRRRRGSVRASGAGRSTRDRAGGARGPVGRRGRVSAQGGLGPGTTVPAQPGVQNRSRAARRPPRRVGAERHHYPPAAAAHGRRRSGRRW